MKTKNCCGLFYNGNCKAHGKIGRRKHAIGAYTLVQRQCMSANESPYSVHAHGCTAIPKDIGDHDGFEWPEIFATLAAIEQGTDGWTLADMNIHGCCKK